MHSIIACLSFFATCFTHQQAPTICPTLSPEIADGWASYDERVDSYSLGILTFELWHPFSTGMERAILLRDLREHGVMPAEFEAANPQVWRRGVKGWGALLTRTEQMRTQGLASQHTSPSL